MVLQLIDTVGALPTSQGGHANPLWDNPYTGITFTFNGVDKTLDFGAYNNGTTGETAPTYEGLIAQIQAAIAGDPELSGLGLVVSAGTPFDATVGIGQYQGTEVEGTRIVISSDQGSLAGLTWVAENGLPSTNSTSATFDGNTVISCPLITTNIDLDNVGRVQWTDQYEQCLPDEEAFGSASGDMLVGAQGDRAGIERFIVTVDQGSWLSSLSSSNNILRAIEVKAGDINGDGHIGNKQGLANDTNVGELFIGAAQDAPGTAAGDMSHWIVAGALLETDGLSNVKYFNADGYEGHLNIGAEFTNEGYAKYLADVDGLDTVDVNYAPNGAFTYTLGANDDILNMKLHGGMAADNDFRMVIDAGNGDDLVNINFANQDSLGADIAMTKQQVIDSAALRNVVINGGAGDDTIWSWGDGAVTVNGGADDDSIYVGQTAGDTNAVWAFNVDANNKQIDVTNAGAQADNNNFLATNATTQFNALAAAQAGYGIYVEVTFKGITSEVRVGNYTVNADGSIPAISTLDINKAIIQAIESDSVLGEVLAAKDGAGYGLIIESLIDGVMATNDLTIDFRAWNGITGTGSLEAGLTDPDSDYASQFAQGDTPTSVVLDPTVTSYTPGAVAAKEVFKVDFGIDLANLKEGDVLTISVNGTEYTTAAAGAGNIDTVANFISWISAAQTGAGAALSVAYDTIAGTALNDITFTATNNGATTGVVLDAGLASTDLTMGNAEGTYSINRVEGGAGDDVIVLNAGSHNDADLGHLINDTLVISGAFGNDTVFNFDTGIDNVEFNIGAAGFVGNNGDAVTVPAANSSWEASIAAAVTATASVKSAGYIQVNGTNEYIFFEVNNDAISTVAESEVNILGTITLAAGESFSAANDMINIPA